MTDQHLTMTEAEPSLTSLTTWDRNRGFPGRQSVTECWVASNDPLRAHLQMVCRCVAHKVRRGILVGMNLLGAASTSSIRGVAFFRILVTLFWPMHQTALAFECT